MINNKTGFVIGNGESRLSYSLSSFKTQGIIYGCNALYRDFTPNILVSVDEQMGKEIYESDYDGEYIYVKNKKIYSSHNPDIDITSRGWGSGSTAVWLMCKFNKDIQQINLVGFDLHDEQNKVSNVYAGTKNYKGIHDVPTTTRFWIDQMAIVFKKYPRIEFNRYIANDGFDLPGQWQYLNNVKTKIKLRED